MRKIYMGGLMEVGALMAVMIGFMAGKATASLGEMDLDLGLGLNLHPRATSAGKNLQTFAGALGGAQADPITKSSDPKHPFSVGGDTFPDFSSALSRSCANQHNACADIANSNKDSGFTTGQCDTQQTSCLAATQGNDSAASSTASAQPTLFSQDANFLYICDV